MEIIKTFKDIDFGLNTPDPDVYRERKAVRAVVFDNKDKVALIHGTNENYHKIPGGGVEEGEDIKEALDREISEEIGCRVTDVKELAAIEEYRNEDALHQISYCFIAKLVGEKGEPKFTQSEIEEGFEPQWLPLDEAIKVLDNEKIKIFYRGKFMVARDLLFLREAKNYAKKL